MKHLVNNRETALNSLVLVLSLIVSYGHCFIAPALSYGSIGAPTSLENAIPDRMIYVNNQHPKASDSNPGNDGERPIEAIGHAAKIAIKNQERGLSTKILIYPGTYREQIKLEFGSRKNSPPIIFEAKEKGTVVVSGSDVWDDWKRIRETDIYVHQWPYKWGFLPGPSQLKEKYGPIVRRREMIFVDHQLMDQVLTFDELKKNTFYISEEESKIYLLPELKRSLNDTIVEVAIRSDLFKINQASNVILKGLSFQHDTTGMSTLGAAVYFVNSTNLLIEDCEFSWNNWFGLRFSSVSNVTTRRNKMVHNGGAGWEAWRVKRLLSEEDETSYNNWRGLKGKFLGWEIAGAKHLNIHDAVYRTYKAVGNHTRGLWLDFDNSNILIEGACLCGNLTDGINLEASEGPIIIRKSLVCANQGYGIVSDSSSVTLEDNKIYGNGKSQIKHAFGNDRSVKNWETGEELKIRGNNLALIGNLIATDSDSLLLELPAQEKLVKSLTSQKNTWYKTSQKDLFRVGKRSMTLRGWNEITGQDEQKGSVDAARSVGNWNGRSCGN